MLSIRKTAALDIDAVMQIYATARRFMAEHGNPGQWVDGYPQLGVLEHDIAAGDSYVCISSEGEIVGTFAFILGDDPTYKRIDDGKWLDDGPYGTIHRIASSGRVKGVAAAALDYCFTVCPDIRIDTHRDNTVMQDILRKKGFTPCGTIYTHDGTPRLAFQKRCKQ